MTSPFFPVFQIILKFGGKRDVFPIMRPDRIFVSVAVVRLVEALTVAPKRLAEVKLQFENEELDKFVPVKSNEAGNVSDE